MDSYESACLERWIRNGLSSDHLDRDPNSVLIYVTFFCQRNRHSLAFLFQLFSHLMSMYHRFKKCKGKVISECIFNLVPSTKKKRCKSLKPSWNMRGQKRNRPARKMNLFTTLAELYDSHNVFSKKDSFFEQLYGPPCFMVALPLNFLFKVEKFRDSNLVRFFRINIPQLLLR